MISVITTADEDAHAHRQPQRHLTITTIVVDDGSPTSPANVSNKQFFFFFFYPLKLCRSARHVRACPCQDVCASSEVQRNRAQVEVKSPEIARATLHAALPWYTHIYTLPFPSLLSPYLCILCQVR